MMSLETVFSGQKKQTASKTTANFKDMEARDLETLKTEWFGLSGPY